MTFSVRQLVPGDTETFIRLRREALDREPSAFLASPDDDRALDPAFVREAFSSTSEATFGAYVWGLYVKPTQRRNGIGRSLMVAALRFARELRGVTHVHLGDGLRKHPTTLIFLALDRDQPVGIVTCFVGFSTFAARPLVNVHDLHVTKDYRRRGVS